MELKKKSNLVPRWPQLQYNYDRPIENNVIDEQPQPPPAYVPAPPSPTEQQYRPQQQRINQHTYKHYEPQYQQQPQQQPQPQYQPQHSDPYRPPHHESFEPEQPADVPVVIGKVVHQGVS